MEKNSGKKLANRISYQIWYKGCLKRKFGWGGGSKSVKGGPYPLADLNWGVQIRCDRDNVSSHLKYYQLSSEILKYKLILFRSIWPRYGNNITVIGMF